MELSTGVEDQEWALRKLAYLSRRTGDYTGELQALIDLSKLPDSSYDSVRNAVRRALTVFKSYGKTFKFGPQEEARKQEKRMFAQQLIDVMESRLEEAKAGDLAWLAWLYLNKGDTEPAKMYAQRGLALDPRHRDLESLADKFQLR